MKTKVQPKNEKLIEKILRNLQKRSQKPLEIAIEIIQRKTVECAEINEAFKQYSKTWNDYLHPGLISIACELVGGNPEKVIEIQVVMLLFSAAFDIHDDIIDNSKIKYGQPTLLKKFGKEITLLVGDAFFIQAFIHFNKFREMISQKKFNMILDIISNKFYELGDAEALEASLKGNIDISPEKYLQILKKKASTIEAHMQIGAILGNGNMDQIKIIGNFGRTLGILMGVREDFIDIFEPEELKNRMINECLPLPMLYAFKSQKNKKTILFILNKETLTENDVDNIVNLIFEDKEVKELKKRLKHWTRNALQDISTFKNREIALQVTDLIKSIMEDL